MDDPKKRSDDAQPADTLRDRRSFIVGAASAGMLGAAAITPALAQSGGAAAASAQDPQAPKGLGPRAMVDNRFPLTYQTSIPQAVRVVTEYFVALSQRNLRGIA